MYELKFRESTRTQKALEDIFSGVLSGTGLVHRFWGHVGDDEEPLMVGGQYGPHSSLLYYSVKLATAALEVLAYYALAENGYEKALIIPAITNFISFSNNITLH